MISFVLCYNMLCSHDSCPRNGSANVMEWMLCSQIISFKIMQFFPSYYAITLRVIIGELRRRCRRFLAIKKHFQNKHYKYSNSEVGIGSFCLLIISPANVSFSFYSVEKNDWKYCMTILYQISFIICSIVLNLSLRLVPNSAWWQKAKIRFVQI